MKGVYIMDYLEIKEDVVKLHLLKVKELENRKNNINSNYTLALQDFRVIDNIEDVIETLEEVISKLEDLQERIRNRNDNSLI